MPGHPAIIKGTASSTAEDQGVFSFELHKYGNIDNTDEGDSFESVCPKVGPIFNPLAEFIWWDMVLNPFADPSRGTIQDVTVDADGRDEDGFFIWTQATFLQNLAGKDSIIGKSIKFNLSQSGTDTRGCCVIGEDEPPQAPPTAAYSHSHQHPQGRYKQTNRVPTYGNSDGHCGCNL